MSSSVFHFYQQQQHINTLMKSFVLTFHVPHVVVARASSIISDLIGRRRGGGQNLPREGRRDAKCMAVCASEG